MPSAEDRAEVFFDEFVKFMDYYSAVDEEYMNHDNYHELKVGNPFVYKIYDLLQEVSEKLSIRVLNDDIGLVFVEMNKHEGDQQKLAPLLDLHEFLKRVRQSERDYYTDKKKSKNRD